MSPATPGVIAFLRNAVGSTQRIASICVAAFTLAEAGLLDGRRATTHWSYARDLQNRFPKIKVEADRIFIADGPVWTSAGMTAGIDLDPPSQTSPGAAIADDAIRRAENHLDHPRSAISRLVSEIARAGLSPFGQVLVQFMIVCQR